MAFLLVIITFMLSEINIVISKKSELLISKMKIVTSSKNRHFN